MIIWRFTVKAGREVDFEWEYGAGGEGERFFRRDDCYLGTELLLPVPPTIEYVTIDRWRSEAAYEAFLRRHENEYAALDARMEALTLC